MRIKEDKAHGPYELDDEDKAKIIEVFDEEIVPRLRNLQARIGTICCDFAGDDYKNWIVHFTSRGRGFDIVDFELLEKNKLKPALRGSDR